MSLQKLRVFQLATKLYHECEKLKLPHHLKSQLLRCSSSVALNLAEGAGRRTPKDRRKFFTIAYGSAKETFAVLSLARVSSPELLDLVDYVSASLYKLCKYSPPS